MVTASESKGRTRGHTRFENLPTGLAFVGQMFLIAARAAHLAVPVTESFISQGFLAEMARVTSLKAGFMVMLILEGKILSKRKQETNFINMERFAVTPCNSLMSWGGSEMNRWS